MDLPEPFTSRILKRLGSNENQAFIAEFYSTPAISIRLNPKRQRTDLDGHNTPWAENGLYLPHRPEFVFDPAWHAGAYYVQEASSMVIEQAVLKVLNEIHPQVALDLCAAPGGKSTHLAALLPEDCLLVSNEPIPKRNKVLVENVLKWGKPNSMVTQAYPDELASSGLQADFILVDAPCSGEGMFRKDNQAIQEWSAENVLACAERQKGILDSAWEMLSPGGFLVYSTCTFAPEENENQLARLIKETNGKHIDLKLPEAWGFEERSLGYAALFHRVKGEGFYFALIQKPGDFSSTLYPGKGKSFENDWIAHPEDWVVFRKGENEYGLPRNHLNIHHLNLKFTLPGLPLILGQGPKEHVAPTLPFAWNFNASAFPKLELNKEDALNWLKGNVLRGQFEKGWIGLWYNGLPLGMGKSAGNRLNNHYPKSWRIRKDIV